MRRMPPLAWALVLVLMGGLLLAAILSRGPSSRSAAAASFSAPKAAGARAGPAAPAHLSAAALRRLHVDEGGLVPVLMYHRIVEPIPAGDPYDRTPAQLRADLARLDREGYTSISMSDFVAGRIDLPAGRSPVVLTFDDSSRSQFHMLGRGQVDPDSAVGIMNAFAAAIRSSGATPSSTRTPRSSSSPPTRSASWTRSCAGVMRSATTPTATPTSRRSRPRASRRRSASWRRSSVTTSRATASAISASPSAWSRTSRG